MTWTTYHHRGAILRTVIATADRRRDGVLPMDLDGVAQTFDDELDLLGALQLRWHTRLAGRIEHTLTDQPLDLETAVVSAWRATAAEMPGVRAILDRHRAEPRDDRMGAAMTRAVDKERLLLAVMSGRGGYGDQLAVPVGAAIEARARAGHSPGQSAGRCAGHRTTTAAAPRQLCLLRRIRSVLAA